MKNHPFTISQIHEAHSRVKSGADFPSYVQELKAVGVRYYDNFVADGKSVYYGSGDVVLTDAPKYPLLKVSEQSSSDQLKHAISIHQQGQTDYPTFCKQAADAGVEKWTTHMVEMTVTYFDKAGNKLIVEPIPEG